MSKRDVERAQKQLEKRVVKHPMKERYKNQDLTIKETLDKLAPDILALRRCGYDLVDISKVVGISYKEIKDWLLVRPEYSEVACTRAYREEYIMATLMQALREGRLSERGMIQLYDLTLRAGLYDIREKIAKVELAIKEAQAQQITGAECRAIISNTLELEGITSQDVATVMKSMAQRQSQPWAGTPFADGSKDPRINYSGVFAYDTTQKVIDAEG